MSLIASKEEKKVFVNKMMAAMPKDYTKTFSLFTVAQAVIESSWGKGFLSKYNNYFGIKFFGNITDQGVYVSLSASEGGISNFRIFPSLKDCFAYRYKFLTDSNGRYHVCWKIMLEDDYGNREKILSMVERYGTCLQLAGYCSNTDYGDILSSLAEEIMNIQEGQEKV